MVSTKKIIAMARKWRRVTAFSRKLSLGQTDVCSDSDVCTTTSVASKGHFTVYSVDQKRFMVPLAYLENSIFVELFKLSEDEFGYYQVMGLSHCHVMLPSLSTFYLHLEDKGPKLQKKCC